MEQLGARPLFVGYHEHKIDGQGRVILPSGYRSQLGDSLFVVLMEECLGIYTVAEFERIAARMLSEAEPEVWRAWSGNAQSVQPDEQGRILIRSNLRQQAGLGKRVVVAGAIRHVELWDPPRWEHVNEQGGQRVNEAVAGVMRMGDG